MRPAQRPPAGQRVRHLLAFSALLVAVCDAAGPCAVRVSRTGPLLRLSGGSDGPRALRLSGGHEYGDDYDGGGAVSLAEVAQEVRGKEDKEDGGAGGERGGGGGGGRGAGAMLSAEAFRKQHEISVRKLGSRSGCEQLEPVQSFGKAPFSPEILRAIRSAGFSAPSPIQAQCWPYLAAKHDLVAVAKTGSGKVRPVPSWRRPFFARAKAERRARICVHSVHAPACFCTAACTPRLRQWYSHLRATPDVRVPAAGLHAHPQGHSRA